MLKKTLVSLALASAFVAGNAQAINITISGTDVDYSFEGTANSDALDFPEVTVELDTSYLANDLITLTFNSNLDEDLEAGDLTITGAEAGSISVESISGNTIVLKTTSAITAAAGTTDDIVINGIDVDAAAARNVAADTNGERHTTVLVASSRAGSAIETLSSTNSTNALAESSFAVVNEFTTAFTSTATVNLAADGELDANLVFALDVNEANGGDLDADTDATITKTVYTITGDFSFVDDESTAAGINNTSVDRSAGTGSFTLDSNTLIVTVTGSDPASTITFTDEPNLYKTNAIVGGQAFSVVANVTYNDADANPGAVSFSDADTVETTYAGHSYSVTAVPFGSNVEQFVWVTNNDNDDAFASFTIKANGSTFGPFDGGKVAKGATTRLGALVQAAAADSGLTSGRGEVVLNIGTAATAASGAQSASFIDAAATAGTTAGVGPATAANTDSVVVISSTTYDFDVYAGYKVVSADDRLNLPVVRK